MGSTGAPHGTSGTMTWTAISEVGAVMLQSDAMTFDFPANSVVVASLNAGPELPAGASYGVADTATGNMAAIADNTSGVLTVGIPIAANYDFDSALDASTEFTATVVGGPAFNNNTDPNPLGLHPPMTSPAAQTRQFVSPPATAIFGADGTASVSFTTPVGLGWIVTRIAVSSTSSFPTDAYVYVNGVFQLGTGAGNGDSATGNPMPIQEGSEVMVSWTGGQPGAVATATLTYYFA